METELVLTPTAYNRKVAIVGAGPAGMACAVAAAERGFSVDLFDKNDHVGGQFNLAMQIPGKEEFKETIRYFTRRLAQTGVNVKLGHTVTENNLSGYDEVIIATGVKPRIPPIPGVDNPKVIDYQALIRDKVQLGNKVAVIGAGGIGVDVSTMLTEPENQNLSQWLEEWGIDQSLENEGGLLPYDDYISPRQVWLMQRKPGKVGKGPGRTTGWIHRRTLEKRGVELLGGVSYDKIDDEGLHITVEGQSRLLPVDHIVLCTGQTSVEELSEKLASQGINVNVIGGADEAGEVDAKRVIRQGDELAAKL